MQILPISDWFPDFPIKDIVIAGPCSAESEKQVLETAHFLKTIPLVKVFRAGIWKPRTRPGSFEGVGKKGLKWLQKVKDETSLKIAVEVANPEHAQMAIDSGIDVLWIGARTTGSPFAIQELADFMKDYDMPVLVKNPIHPDMDLWIGAIERFYHAGIHKIAAVHRGFSPFGKSPYRNIPKWEIPIELKSRIHSLPIISDPSHIAGRRAYIFDLAQKALDINMDGLMIEVHSKPEEAKSDALQQLSPKDFADILGRMKFKRKFSDNEDFAAALSIYRDQIDSIDSQLIELLGSRMKIVEQIGVFKKENQITIFQLERLEELKRQWETQGKCQELNIDFIRQILALIHKESILRQS